MQNYVFLGTVLPPLQFGQQLDFGFDALLEIYKMNMNRSDLEKVESIRRYIDLRNVLEHLKKNLLDHRGNLTEREIDEALLSREGLPSYLYDYLDEHETVEEQIQHFSKVFMQFFNGSQQKKGSFLEFLFSFEREWRLLMVGYRAKELNLDIAKELQHEDFHDPFVMQILAQKDSPYFEFPFEYSELGDGLKDLQKDPMEHYDFMAEFRFDQIEERIQNVPFSVDYALGYLVQFMIV